MRIEPFRRISTDESDEIFEVALERELLLDYPLLNKGSAFSEEERHEFSLNGLLPAHVSTMEDQVSRNYENYRRNDTDLERYLFLTALQDRNETLFYRLVEEHIAEMLPVIYTPVVGVASQSYSHIYRSPRGLYIPYLFCNEIESILRNSPVPDVRAIVVTDGERILGLGDLGIGGMGIPVGKLSLYTLCAGVHPATTLPIFLDVGTNNKSLLDDPLYLGWKHERVRGQDYDDFIDAFVQSVKKVFPNVLLQWEDFSRSNARRLLDRYKNELCTFNDDIQGTGAVALAGLLSAVKAKKERLSDQTFVIMGAGSAATGVAEMIVAGMVREGASEADPRRSIWMLDIGGLLHTRRADLETYNAMYAQDYERLSGWNLPDSAPISLADVVSHVNPTVLVGLCGQACVFSENIIRTMAARVQRPIIFPLSNPTRLSEASPADLLQWTDGKALIATGSPFPEVEFNGKPLKVAQCNNVYIFPGVGLGVLAFHASRVTNEMFMAAAEALSGLSPALENPDKPLLPDIESIRDVSRVVATAVGREAVRAGLAPAVDDWDRPIARTMWFPRYAKYKKV